MYNLMADIYDLFYHFKDYKKESDFLIKLIHDHKPDSHSLLEIACGTGRFLEFLQDEYQVTGVDLSEPMLKVAKQRLNTVPLLQGNMVDFNLEKQFDVVCCLFRSIAYCKTLENLNDTLANMAQHTAPGGMVIIEPYYSPETLWEGHVDLNQLNEGETKLACMYVTEKIGTLAILNLHCLVGTKEGVKHFSEISELGLFTTEQYMNAFQSAGLDSYYDENGPSGIGLFYGFKPH